MYVYVLFTLGVCCSSGRHQTTSTHRVRNGTIVAVEPFLENSYYFFAVVLSGALSLAQRVYSSFPFAGFWEEHIFLFQQQVLWVDCPNKIKGAK
jgi:hypothetical protein